MITRHSWILLTTTILLGIAVRALVSSNFDLNPDEGLYYLIGSTADFTEFLRLISTQAHPPLYYYIVRLLTWIGSPEIVRLFTSIFSVLSVIIGTLIGTRISRNTGIVFGALLAFSPAMVGLGSLIRPYALILFLVLSLIAFCEQLLVAPKSSRYATFGVFSIASLLILIHYGAIPFVYLAIGLVVLFAHSKKLSTSLPLVFGLVALGALVAFLYTTHLRGFSAGTLWSGYQANVLYPDSLHHLSQVSQIFLSIFRFLLGPVGPFALLFVMIGTWRLLKKRNYFLLALAGLYLLTAITLSLIARYPLSPNRHSIYLLPILLLLVSAGIGGAADFIFAKLQLTKRGSFIGELILLCTIASTQIFSYLQLSTEAPGITLVSPVDGEQFVLRRHSDALLTSINKACAIRQPTRSCTLLLDLSSFNVLAPRLGLEFGSDASSIFEREWQGIRVIVWPGWNFGGTAHRVDTAQKSMRLMAQGAIADNRFIAISIDYTPFDCREIAALKPTPLYLSRSIKACQLTVPLS